MVRYPIVVRVIPGGRKVSFPDFPGCCFNLRPKEGELATEEEFQAAIRSRALAWLVGTPEAPGWIPTRLRGGYTIAQPGTYQFRLLNSEIELEADPLPENLAAGLEIHWTRVERMKTREEMARMMAINLDRLAGLEEGQIKANHRDRVMLRHVRQSSQTRLRADFARQEEDFDILAS
ncbi:MAG: hypothetical protein PHC70_02230 [Patescibacteria group bacterium]|jgi:hypothetical protein|nr:hypothetical protein [Patescibacteria group bacterium]